MSESSSSGTSNLFVNVKEISVFADCAVTISSPLTGVVSPNMTTNYLHFKNPPNELVQRNNRYGTSVFVKMGTVMLMLHRLAL